jgi:hypothetical protein
MNASAHPPPRLDFEKIEIEEKIKCTKYKKNPS